MTVVRDVLLALLAGQHEAVALQQLASGWLLHVVVEGPRGLPAPFSSTMR